MLGHKDKDFIQDWRVTSIILIMCLRTKFTLAIEVGDIASCKTGGKINYPFKPISD